MKIGEAAVVLDQVIRFVFLDDRDGGIRVVVAELKNDDVTSSSY